MEKVEAFLTSYNQAMSVLENYFSRILNEVFQEFWRENPKIAAVSWTQSTPTFNDGDPCVFSVGYPCFVSFEDPSNVMEVMESFDEEEFPEGCEVFYSRSEKIVGGACIEKFLTSNQSATFLENMFGESNRVVATREGFTTEEFCPY